MKWLDKLDCSIKYRGEGLPSISYKVLVKLVRTKERRYLEGEEKHALMEDWVDIHLGNLESKFR